MLLNERRVTLDRSIWGTARRDKLFSGATSLFFTHVQLVHRVQNALLDTENRHIAASRMYTGRALV